MNSNNELTLKIITLGSSKVGKTCLINQYFNKEFNDTTICTIGIDLQSKFYKFDNELVKINFIDTAGQEKFDSISNNYFRNVNGVLLVYDITNNDSFKKMEYWNNQIIINNDNNYSIILVGNKKDLDNLRQVKKEDGINMAKKINCKFYETSAKNNENVEEVFENIAFLTYQNFKGVKNKDNNNFSLEKEQKKKKCCGGNIKNKNNNKSNDNTNRETEIINSIN